MSETVNVNTVVSKEAMDFATSPSEPEWLKEARNTAWQCYQKTPMPTVRDEQWRKIDLSTYDLAQPQRLPLGPVRRTISSLPQWFTAIIEQAGQASGIFYQGIGCNGYLEILPELEKKGVIFCDLCTAIQKHENIIRPYLLELSLAESDGKFLLLNKALFNCGFFLYVPEGIVIETPIVAGFGLDWQYEDTICSAIYPRSLIVAESNSKIEIIHVNGTEHSTKPQNHNGNINRTNPVLIAGVKNTHVGNGAKVSFLELDDFPNNVLSINTNRADVSRDGTLNSLTVALGGKHTKTDIITRLQEAGANSEILGLILGDNNNQFSFNTIQEHNAPDTISDINFRVALKDSASSVYQGIIKVTKSAQRTNAYQQNKNLLLGSAARADSIPKLEILADDVKCSHGATVGPVDAEQVFYLQSRGLSQQQAEELIVMGFFEQVLEKFAISKMTDWLSYNITKRIHGF